MGAKQDAVFTITELAAYLKISKSTLYKLVREGKIPCQKIGRHWRFRKAAIDNTMDRSVLAPDNGVQDDAGIKRTTRALPLPAPGQELFSAVVNHMLDAALILDWDGAILYANNSALRLIEMPSLRLLIGQNAARFVHPDSLHKVVEDLGRVKEGKGGFLAEYLLKTAKGNELWAEGLGTKISLAGRETDLVILRDVTVRRRLEGELRQAYSEQERRIDERTAALGKTNDDLRAEIKERRRIEEALKLSEERYRTFLDTLTDMIFITDRRGRFVYVNPALEHCLGRRAQDLEGDLFTKIVAPDDRKGTVERYRRGMAGENVPVYEIDFLCRDGATIPVELNVTTYRDEGGQPAGRIGVARNIADRREAEKLFSIMARTSAAGVYIVQDGRFQFINQHAAAYAGYEEEEMIGREALAVIHPDDREEARQKAVRTLRGGDVKPYSFRILTKQGRIRWIMETLTTIQYRGRRAVLGNSMDVTERMEMEKQLAESEVRYRAVFEKATDGILILEKGNFRECNQKALEIFRCREEDIVGRSPAEYSTPRQPGGGSSRKLAQERIKLAGGGVPQFFPWRHRRKDGTPFFAEVSLNPLNIPGKKLIQAIVRDISERKAAEEALRAGEERYRMIVENIDEGYYETDLRGRLTFVNEACKRITGLRREDLLGKSFRNFIGGKDAKRIYGLFGVVHETGQSIRDLVWEAVRPDGEKRHMEISASLVRDMNGLPVGFRGIIRDVTERRRAEEEVQWIAYHDHLTGLPNRLLFQDRFSQLQAHAKRKGERFAVILLDLDRFKDINDRFGHEIGDQFLISVGARLSERLREGDTVARMGGDEFLLLLPGIRLRKDGVSLGEKIMEGFQEPFVVGDRHLSISASAGLAVYPDDGQDYETLLRKADGAMYQAKADGRNLVAGDD